MTGQVAILCGDARHLPLRDATVDLVICSPPYYGLRAYGAGPGEIGSEPHWQDWLNALLDATREMVRVLKPMGSIWINLGDKYAADNRGSGQDAKRGAAKFAPAGPRGTTENQGVREKSLLGLPWRYALACIDQLGLILRAELIWQKPNGLPESVTDRVRRSHEVWFHLVRQPRYYAAIDEIREPHMIGNGGRQRALLAGTNQYADRTYGAQASMEAKKGYPGQQQNGLNSASALHPLGKLPGSVWNIPSEPLRLPPWIDTQHYASFPSEWPRRLILGFSPPGVCVACGQGRWPVVEKDRCLESGRRVPGLGKTYQHDQMAQEFGGTSYLHQEIRATILGYACACTPHTNHRGKRGDWRESREESADHLNAFDLHAPGNAVPRRPGGFGPGGKNPPPEVPMIEYHLNGWHAPPTRPAVVLDPFGGTGCSAHVAAALGRIGVSIDLSMPYCRVAKDRTLARQRADKVTGRRNLELQGTLDLTADGAHTPPDLLEYGQKAAPAQCHLPSAMARTTCQEEVQA